MKLWTMLLMLPILCAACTINVNHRPNQKPVKNTPIDWDPMSEGNGSVAREYLACDSPETCSQSLREAFSQLWLRPPGASNEMKAKFEILLNERYEIIYLRLDKSSGFFAFDRSAAKAIMNASPYRELAGLSIDDYIKYFSKEPLKNGIFSSWRRHLRARILM